MVTMLTVAGFSQPGLGGRRSSRIRGTVRGGRGPIAASQETGANNPGLSTTRNVEGLVLATEEFQVATIIGIYAVLVEKKRPCQCRRPESRFGTPTKSRGRLLLAREF